MLPYLGVKCLYRKSSLVKQMTGNNK